MSQTVMGYTFKATRNLTELTNLALWYDYKFVAELFGTSPDRVKRLLDQSGDTTNTLLPWNSISDSAKSLKYDASGFYRDAAMAGTGILRAQQINPNMNFLHKGTPWFLTMVLNYADYAVNNAGGFFINTGGTSSTGVIITHQQSLSANTSPRLRIRIYNAGVQLFDVFSTGNVMPLGSNFLLSIKFYGSLLGSANLRAFFGGTSVVSSTVATSGYATGNHSSGLAILAGTGTDPTKLSMKHIAIVNCNEVANSTDFDTKFNTAIEIIKLDSDYSSLTTP